MNDYLIRISNNVYKNKLEAESSYQAKYGLVKGINELYRMQDFLINSTEDVFQLYIEGYYTKFIGPSRPCVIVDFDHCPDAYEKFKDVTEINGHKVYMSTSSGGNGLKVFYDKEYTFDGTNKEELAAINYEVYDYLMSLNRMELEEPDDCQYLQYGQLTFGRKMVNTQSRSKFKFIPFEIADEIYKEVRKQWNAKSLKVKKDKTGRAIVSDNKVLINGKYENLKFLNIKDYLKGFEELIPMSMKKFCDLFAKVIPDEDMYIECDKYDYRHKLGVVHGADGNVVGIKYLPYDAVDGCRRKTLTAFAGALYGRVVTFNKLLKKWNQRPYDTENVVYTLAHYVNTRIECENYEKKNQLFNFALQEYVYISNLENPTTRKTNRVSKRKLNELKRKYEAENKEFDFKNLSNEEKESLLLKTYRPSIFSNQQLYKEVNKRLGRAPISKKEAMTELETIHKVNDKIKKSFKKYLVNKCCTIDGEILRDTIFVLLHTAKEVDFNQPFFKSKVRRCRARKYIIEKNLDVKIIERDFTKNKNQKINDDLVVVQKGEYKIKKVTIPNDIKKMVLIDKVKFISAHNLFSRNVKFKNKKMKLRLIC